MKHSVYQQFATIQEDTASLFDARLNEKVHELRDRNPKVAFSEHIPFYAHITYTVNEDAPETIAEASAVEGVSFVCCQCPYFRPALREDGEVDKRVKWGGCEHTELGRTLKTAPACERLYQLIKEGDVKLCFMD
jgi:hypothetical protein